MTVNSFVLLLFAFSTLTSLVVEGIKQNFLDGQNRKYNLIALVVAMIIGSIGTILYYYLNHMLINFDAFIIAFLMGLASSLVSMVGFDKVKQAIEQFGK